MLIPLVFGEKGCVTYGVSLAVKILSIQLQKQLWECLKIPTSYSVKFLACSSVVFF